MDGAELLEYLPTGSKWPSLNKSQQLFVVILSFGAICGALTAIKSLLLDSIIPTTRWASNMTSIAYYGITMGQYLDLLFNVALVLAFSFVTYIITQRGQDKIRGVEARAEQDRNTLKKKHDHIEDDRNIWKNRAERAEGEAIDLKRRLDERNIEVKKTEKELAELNVEHDHLWQALANKDQYDFNEPYVKPAEKGRAKISTSK